MLQKKDSLYFKKILFQSDEMPVAEIKRLLKSLKVQKQRWIGGFHPDSRVRSEAFRASGVQIGNNTFISIGLVVLDAYKQLVNIGNRAAFGNYVTLIASSGPNDSLLSKHPEVMQRCIKTAPICIDDDVWVGAGVIVLPGVRIGKSSIIGAGAVIKEDVLPYSIVAGIPGRVIRTIDNFDQLC